MAGSSIPYKWPRNPTRSNPALSWMMRVMGDAT